MPVLAFQNGNRGLVGKIVQVGVFTSQVMPIYNINNNVSARIQNTRDLGLVSGLGNPDSFMSFSHGAGRRMSRAEAFKSLRYLAESDVSVALFVRRTVYQ